MADGVWRTISGRKVFIKKGQSLTEAMKESGKFKDLKGNSIKDERLGYLDKKKKIIDEYKQKTADLGIDIYDMTEQEEERWDKLLEERGEELKKLKNPFKDAKTERNFLNMKRLFEENYPEIYNEIGSWDVINKSPYSNSFYDSDGIGWGKKPAGSKRIADHWNFGEDKKLHCETREKRKRKNGWAMGVYKDGLYNIEMEFENATY